MSDLVIKSVLHPDNIRFASVDGFYDSGLLVYSFGKYETMGDGECAHTPTYRIGAADFTDFCLSVAAHIVAHPDTKVHGYQLGLKQVDRATYDFLLSVKHSEKDRKWFSLQLKKVSKDDNKRHDKRWLEVPSWADGTPKAAHDLYFFALECRCTLLEAYSIREAFLEYAGGYFYQHDECCKWTKELTGDYQHAFRALKSAFDAKEAFEMATRCIEAATYNMKRSAEIEAEKAATAAA